MVALMVGQMNLQQMQSPVDGFSQTELLHQQPHRAQAAIGQALRPLGQLILDVAGPHHRRLATLAVVSIDPAFDAALAGGQCPAYLGVHSKSLRGCGCLRS